MNIETLNYTILGLDEERMVIHVKFEDHGVVSFQLRAPLPTTEAEVHEMIKRYAPTVESIQAVVTKPDLTFIKSLFDKPMSTPRHSAVAEIEAMRLVALQREKQQANEFVLVEPSVLAQQNLADRETIKSLIREVMAEQNG